MTRRLGWVLIAVLWPSLALAQFPSVNVRLPAFVIPASAVNGGGSFSGQLLGPASPTNCSVPQYSFTGDTDTGLGYGGANTVDICANGASFFQVTPTYAWARGATFYVGPTGGTTLVELASGRLGAQALTASGPVAVSATTGVSVANVAANSCGTSAATIAGNENAGNITVGATAGTQCRITFTTAAVVRRHCTATNETTANLLRTTYVTTTTTDVLGTMVAGDTLSYVCLPR